MSMPRSPIQTHASLRALDDVPRRPDGRVDLAAACRALGPASTDLLESSPDVPGTGRWSYLALASGPRLVADDAGCRLESGADSQPLPADPFAAIDEVVERCGLTDGQLEVWGPADGPGFSGGLVGVLSYELGRHVERLPAPPPSDRDLPLVDLRLAETIVAVDHEHERAYLVQRRLLADSDLERQAERVVAALRGAAPLGPPPRPARQTAETSLAADGYERAVRQAKEAIAAGEVFQLNVTQRMTALWPSDTLDLYRALRQVSPAGFGAALSRPWGGVASISPEQFLVVRDRTVTARPIKGTRPRGSDHRRDQQLADDLGQAAKDRAENVMIVDLVRNDLGRVAKTGSVRVPRLLEVERHPTVWHLVSDVVAELRDDVTVGDLFRATFPCGSVTGAPKVRACELIDAIEPVRRDLYCGSIGYISAGSVATSVAIRTATLHRNGQVDYGAGGGVVADSDPTAEHLESLDKAAAFLSALAATDVRAR